MNNLRTKMTNTVNTVNILKQKLYDPMNKGART